MSQKNNSFIVYTEIREPLEDLTDEQMGKLFRALLDYVADGKRPGFRGAMRMAFSFITQSIDRNTEKYRGIVEHRSAAGRAGGLASGEARRAAKSAEANEANASFASTNEANEANEANASLLEATKQTKHPVPVPVPVPDPIPVPVSVNNTARARAREDGQTQTTGPTCVKCGRKITEGIASYSFDQYGLKLCQDCQKKTPKKSSQAWTGDHSHPGPEARKLYERLLKEEEEAGGLDDPEPAEEIYEEVPF